MANSSIKNIENENTTARRETVAQIRAAFESNGIEFLPGSGVKLKSDAVTMVQGKEATPTLLTSLYTTAHTSADREILILGLDEQLAAQYDGLARLKDHNARLKKADIKQKILTSEGVTEFLGDPSSYRLLPRDSFGRTSPIYIYGDRIATHTGTLRRHTMIVENKSMAQLLRTVFFSLWSDARGPLSVDVTEWGTRMAAAR